jgi:hypothetical protein
MIRRSMFIWGIIAAVSFTTTSLVNAKSATSTIYRLNQNSTYQEECVPPSACAISQPTAVIGTFIATPTPGAAVATYQISDVNWAFIFGDQQIQVTGSGTYEIGGAYQRLQLTLAIGNQPPMPFDSRWVPVSPKLPFPNIVITLSNMADFFKETFAVNASPAPEAAIQPYELLSGSTFQRGCFPPCLCAVGPQQPLNGDFVLVKLPPNPLFRQFAVVNINWMAAPPLASIPIHGFGFYQIGGEAAAQQEMSLELAVDDGPLTPFDGSFAADVRFPLIDVTLSIPGGQCDNAVIAVTAAPLTAVAK